MKRVRTFGFAVLAALWAALILGAKLCERFLPGIRQLSKARRIAIISICSALAARPIPPDALRSRLARG